METTKQNKKKLKFSCLDLVSNTESDRETISATGLSGTIIIFVALIVYIACVTFYFFNVTEAGNITTMMNSATTLIGIGAGVLGVRRVSSDFGPNNRITIGTDKEERQIISKRMYRTPQPEEIIEEEIVEENQTED